MADDVLKSFFVSLGWKNDEAGQKRVERSVAEHEKIVRASDARVARLREEDAKASEQLAARKAAAEARAALETAKASEKVIEAKRRESKENAEAIALAITKLNLFVDAAISASAKIGGAVAGAITGMNQLYYVSGRTGASVESIKNLGHAFGQVGGSMGQAVSALESFARSMRTNEGLAGFVKDLGVDTTKDKALQLLDVVDRLKKEGYQVGSQQAEMLGIDEGTFNLLAKYGEQVRHFYAERKKAAKDFNLDEQEAAKASARLMQGLGSLSATVEVAFTKMLTAAAPRLSKWIDDLRDWVHTHQKEIGEFLEWIAQKVEWVGQKIAEFVEGMAGTLQDKEKQKAFDEWREGFNAIGNAVTRLLDLSDKLSKSALWKVLTWNPARDALAGWITSPAEASTGGGSGATGGRPGAPSEDRRSWYERHAPRWAGGKDAPGPVGGTPSGSREGSLTALIDAEARKAGIDPRIMHGIRAGESGKRQNGTNPAAAYDKKDDAIESSWGPFQLNRRRGLGVQFEKETGLDVRDPKTIPDQVRWVAEGLRKNGRSWLRNWMGYRGDREADPRWGDSGYTPTSTQAGPSVAGGAHPLGGAGRLSSDFGMRKHPLTGEMKMHNGVDLAAPAGTNVQAMQAGVVSLGASGDVTLKHSDGTTTIYRHVVSGVKEGEKVTAGQIIASLRKHDARSTGPHLHFEARDKDGNLVDPKVLLRIKRDETAQTPAPSKSAEPTKTPDYLRGPGGFDVNNLTRPSAPLSAGTVTNSSSSLSKTLNQTNNYNVDIKDSRGPEAHAKVFRDTTSQMGQLHLENAQRAFA